MAGGTVAFLIWGLVGIVFIVVGIISARSKITAGFWANVKPPQIDDIPAYNRAVGKLWITFGTLFIITGLPLLEGQNSPWVFVSVLGAVFEMIALMIAYFSIEGKYRKK